MKSNILYACVFFVIAACSTSKNSSALMSDGKVSDDYGYSQTNPVKVGGGMNGPANEHKYLRRLTGPNGESIAYERLGSCCHFETKNSAFGSGMLDRYEIEIDGDSVKKILYINMYDEEKVYAPKGFLLDGK